MNNSNVKINDITILSNNWYTLKKVNFDYTLPNGTVQNQNREAYDRGNGAVILLYNKQKGTVVLTRQFRMPTYLNGNKTGLMVEAPAGLLDAENPEACIKRETEEETGYRITEVKKVFEAYMSPGSVTEILHFFVAEYDSAMKVGEGGGHEAEHENIEVLEIPFAEALQMMQSGQINDAKTMMLLLYAQVEGLLKQ